MALRAYDGGSVSRGRMLMVVAVSQAEVLRRRCYKRRLPRREWGHSGGDTSRSASLVVMVAQPHEQDGTKRRGNEGKERRDQVEIGYMDLVYPLACLSHI